MRLFFALWPDEDVRQGLDRLGRTCRETCGGRRIPARNLHATVAFLGEVAPRRVATLRRIGTALRSPPFDLVIDRVGCFRRSGIVYAGASVVPAALAELAADMKRSLHAAGFPIEERTFVPHVTLLRDARTAPLADHVEPRLLWQVRHIELVDSARGPEGQVYRPVGRFILGA